MYLPTCVYVYIPVYYSTSLKLYYLSVVGCIISCKLTLNLISVDIDDGLFFKKAFVCLTAVLPFTYNHYCDKGSRSLAQDYLL